MGFSKDKNGKYYCTKHHEKLQWCRNRSTGKYFLKCPYNKKFECGTIDISQEVAIKYDPYCPGLDNAIANYVAELIEKDDEEEKE